MIEFKDHYFYIGVIWFPFSLGVIRKSDTIICFVYTFIFYYRLELANSMMALLTFKYIFNKSRESYVLMGLYEQGLAELDVHNCLYLLLPINKE